MKHLKFAAFFIVLAAVSEVYLENETATSLDYLENPCYGHKNGFARDLAACERYFYCENGNAYPGSCEPNYVFDAETELCVSNQDSGRACFRCAADKTYELVSVPNACPQFIRCFEGRPTLHICSNQLAFDGRGGIHQCNRAPSPNTCFREDPDNLEHSTCPPIYDGPIYFVDQRRHSVYYVCYGQERPERYECPSGLQFNVLSGACDQPRKAKDQKD